MNTVSTPPATAGQLCPGGCGETLPACSCGSTSKLGKVATLVAATR